MTWMNCKEYAEHLKASKHAVQDMCKQGTIVAVKIGNAYRIAVEKSDEQLLSLQSRHFKRAVMPTLDEAKKKYLEEAV